MKRPSHKRENDALSRYRAAVDADDGADPRAFQKQGTSPHRARRKTQQLCSQVAQTLEQLLAEAADPALQMLQIVEVSPAPDATQLLVVVTPIVPAAELDLPATSAAIERAAGWLRSQVAGAITRKRAPQLVFRLVPGSLHKEGRA
jgi:ribosome-binding factor A